MSFLLFLFSIFKKVVFIFMTRKNTEDLNQDVHPYRATTKLSA